VCTPALSREDLDALASDRLSLDKRTRTWINDRYSFRYVLTRDRAQARSWECLVQAGALDAGKPFLNPL